MEGVTRAKMACTARASADLQKGATSSAQCLSCSERSDAKRPTTAEIGTAIAHSFNDDDTNKDHGQTRMRKKCMEGAKSLPILL